MSDTNLSLSTGSHIQALENELAMVRNELLNLQSARSVRVAKFVKQALNSKPAEWTTIARSIPDIFKRSYLVTAEKMIYSNSKSGFNPLYNPQPLYRYPNVNVATLGRYATDLFDSCCNTVKLGDERFRELIQYDSIALIILSVSEYTEEQKNTIKRTLKSGSKLVVISTSDSFIDKAKKDFGCKFLVLTSVLYNKNSIQPFIDIYSLTYNTVSPSGDIRIITNDTLLVNLKSQIKTKLSENIHYEDFLERDLVVLSYNSSDKGPSLQDLELIARGVPTVILTKSKNFKAPDPVIITTTDKLTAIVNDLSQPYRLERYSLSCRREVINNCNKLKAVEAILSTQAITTKTPTVSVILASKRPNYVNQAIEQLENQTMQPSEVFLNLHGVNDTDFRAVSYLVQKSKLNIVLNNYDKSMLFGEVLNAAVDKTTSDYITKMDDDDYYGPNHIKDLYVASLHSRADFVGKWSNWVYLKSENKTINWVPENHEGYVKHLPGGTLFCRAGAIKSMRFGLVKRAIDSELYRRASVRGATLYSTHRYNYIRVRDDDHTYKTTNADFKTRSHPAELNGLSTEITYL